MADIDALAKATEAIEEWLQNRYCAHCGVEHFKSRSCLRQICAVRFSRIVAPDLARAVLAVAVGAATQEGV